MRVYILLFNAGTDNEGIHTILKGDRNKVLMFVSEDDALRYALMLEAQDFPEATVESIESEEVEDFCRQADYDWEIVEKDRLEIPPTNNVENTEWQDSQDLDNVRRRLEGLL